MKSAVAVYGTAAAFFCPYEDRIIERVLPRIISLGCNISRNVACYNALKSSVSWHKVDDWAIRYNLKTQAEETDVHFDLQSWWRAKICTDFSINKNATLHG